MDIVIKQNLSTHELMSLFDQYGRVGIEVMVPLSKETKALRKVGRVAEMYPRGQAFNARLVITERMRSKSKEGFIFSNHNGAWVLHRPN